MKKLVTCIFAFALMFIIGCSLPWEDVEAGKDGKDSSSTEIVKDDNGVVIQFARMNDVDKCYVSGNFTKAGGSWEETPGTWKVYYDQEYWYTGKCDEVPTLEFTVDGISSESTSITHGYMYFRVARYPQGTILWSPKGTGIVPVTFTYIGSGTEGRVEVWCDFLGPWSGNADMFDLVKGDQNKWERVIKHIGIGEVNKCNLIIDENWAPPMEGFFANGVELIYGEVREDLGFTLNFSVDKDSVVTPVGDNLIWTEITIP